jgi:hypothetical protein
MWCGVRVACIKARAVVPDVNKNARQWQASFGVDMEIGDRSSALTVRRLKLGDIVELNVCI